MELEGIFFDRHPNPMMIFDRENFQILRVNKSAVQKYGYSQEEFLGLTIKDIRPQEDIKELHEALQADPSGVANQGNYRHKTQSGEILHVNITAQNYEYEGRNCRLVHIHDVTKTVNLKNKYKDTLEELYHHIGENPLAMIKVDENLKITEWSKRAVQKFGYKRQKAIGKTTFNLGLFPKEEHASIEKNIKKLAEGNVGRLRFSSIAIKKNGEPIYVKIYATALRTDEGNLKSIVAFIENITTQRRTEMLFKTMEEMAQIGGWEYDPQTDDLFWTDAIYEIYGLPKGEKVSVDKALNFFVDQDKSALKEELNKALTEHKTYDSEYQLETPDGEPKWVRTMGKPVKRKGKLFKIVGTLQNITNQKLREIEINKNAKEKEVLLAEIHHRVKNNLAVISGLLELKAMSIENEKMSEILRQSQLRIQSMAMIHETLYEAEDFSNLDFSIFVENLVTSIKEAHHFMNKDISIICESVDELELNVNQAIPCGLLINELVTNSFKHAFSDQDEGTIKVKITYDSSVEGVALKVADNGRGFPKAFIKENLDTLGATLIRQLTMQLNGKLNLRNQDGAVAELEFTLEDKPGSSSQQFNFN